MPRFEQVYKHKERIQLARILAKSSVACFGVPPLAFDDLERMLNDGANEREFSVALLLTSGKQMVPSFLA